MQAIVASHAVFPLWASSFSRQMWMCTWSNQVVPSWVPCMLHKPHGESPLVILVRFGAARQSHYPWLAKCHPSSAPELFLATTPFCKIFLQRWFNSLCEYQNHIRSCHALQLPMALLSVEAVITLILGVPSLIVATLTLWEARRSRLQARGTPSCLG